MTCFMQLESVARIFDEHRSQDVVMLQQRDEIQRSYQDENDDYQECIWMYDSNLYRELLKYVLLRRSALLRLDSAFVAATT